MIDGVAQSQKDQFHILGVLLDPAQQMAAVAKSAFDQLQLIWQLRSFLEKKDFALITHALVTLIMDYRNILYTVLPLEMTWKLHLVQNVAERMLRETSKLDDHNIYGPLRSSLKSLHECNEFTAGIKRLYNKAISLNWDSEQYQEEVRMSLHVYYTYLEYMSLQ